MLTEHMTVLRSTVSSVISEYFCDIHFSKTTKMQKKIAPRACGARRDFFLLRERERERRAQPSFWDGRKKSASLLLHVRTCIFFMQALRYLENRLLLSIGFSMFPIGFSMFYAPTRTLWRCVKKVVGRHVFVTFRLSGWKQVLAP